MKPLATSTAVGAYPSAVRTKQHSLLIYLVIAFGFTWAILGLAILAAHGIIALPLSATVLVTVGTLGPLIAALSVTFVEGGRAGVRALLAQAGQWRVRPRWYGAALLLPGTIMLSAFLLWRALGGPALPTPALASWLAVPILIVALVLPALCEEVGWRGYMLPRLQRRFSALVASLIVGAIHACWHLPLWFIPGVGFDGLPFAYFALLVVGLAVLFAWLYNSTGGSLLIIGLMHAAINAYPAPWGMALQTLPADERGVNIQIPVAMIVAVVAILIVLLTDPHTLLRKR